MKKPRIPRAGAEGDCCDWDLEEESEALCEEHQVDEAGIAAWIEDGDVDDGRAPRRPAGWVDWS